MELEQLRCTLRQFDPVLEASIANDVLRHQAMETPAPGQRRRPLPGADGDAADARSGARGARDTRGARGAGRKGGGGGGRGGAGADAAEGSEDEEAPQAPDEFVWVEDVARAASFKVVVPPNLECTVAQLKATISLHVAGEAALWEKEGGKAAGDGREPPRPSLEQKDIVLLFSHHGKRHDKLDKEAMLPDCGVRCGSRLKMLVGKARKKRFEAEFGDKKKQQPPTNQQAQ